MIGALPQGVTNSGTSNTDPASTEEPVSMELDNEDDVWNEALVEMTEPDGNDEIPFPERKFLSLCNEDGTIRDPAGDEANRNHAKGYRSLVGVLLWIGRNCKLHCATGLHHLSKVMSAPTDDAFDCAIWMLQYCYETKQHGIRYKSSGDTSLRVYYDASNAEDPP